jgi:hypothetical protein
MTHHIHDRDSTEAQFFDAYDKLKSDLADERQKNMLLTDQLREANGENRDLSYKVDFLTAEVARVTASREQYERVAIRVSAFAESIASVAVKQLHDLQDEIKATAFAQVPGTVQSEPEAPPDASEPPSEHTGEPAHGPSPSIDDISAVAIGKTFGSGFRDSASFLPMRGGKERARI